jgi:hypothetical protein
MKRLVGGNPFRRVKNKLPGGQPDSRLFNLFNNSVLNFTTQNIRLRMVEQYKRHNSWFNILF